MPFGNTSIDQHISSLSDPAFCIEPWLRCNKAVILMARSSVYIAVLCSIAAASAKYSCRLAFQFDVFSVLGCVCKLTAYATMPHKSGLASAMP